MNHELGNRYKIDASRSDVSGAMPTSNIATVQRERMAMADGETWEAELIDVETITNGLGETFERATLEYWGVDAGMFASRRWLVIRSADLPDPIA